MGEPVHDSQVSMRAELDEQFPVEPIPMVLHPADGMPVPASERSDLAIAQPFTVESVVCVEDTTEWVEVFKDEIEEYESRYGAIPPPLLSKIYFIGRYDNHGEPFERGRTKDPQCKWGHQVSPRGEAGEPPVPVYMLVRPRRERCDHYKRQVFANDDVPNPQEPGHKILYRNCAARRSVGGALMALRDEAVYACDYRSPPDPASTEQYLDAPDRHRLLSNAHLKLLPLFGLTGDPRDYVPAKQETPAVPTPPERDPTDAATG